MGAAKKQDVAQNALAVAVLAAAAALIGLALFAPLYTDEITWKHLLARTLIEGGKVVSLGPQCPSSFTTPLPFVFYPAALFYTLAFSQLGLLGLKVSGIVIAAAWLLRGYLLLARTEAGRAGALRRLATLAAPQMVGVVPLTLVMARSEPLMLHCIAGFVTFPLFAPIGSLQTRRRRVVALLGFFFLTSVFYYSHPKALFFTPLVIVSGLATFSSRTRPVFGALAVAGTLLSAFSGVRLAAAYTRCDEAPIVAGTLARYTLNPRLAISAPLTFLSKGLANLQVHATGVAQSMTLTAAPPGHWLPGVDVTPLVDTANVVTRVVLYGLQVGAPLLVLASLLFVRDPRVRLRVLLAAAIELGLFGNAFTANHHAFYMSGFTVGVSVVVVWLTCSALAEARAPLRRRHAALLTAGGALLQIVALFSAVVTLHALGPPLVRLAHLDGSLIPDQPGSAPVFGAARERGRIRDHAERCGIRGDDSTHLVVDDVTLFGFEHLHRPFMLVNSSDTNMWMPDFPGVKNLELLRASQVPGIIARCVYFPSALAFRTKRSGDYCCVSAKDLELAELPRGERVGFEAGGRGAAYVGTGWLWADDQGRWTDGPVAELRFAAPPGEVVTGLDLQMTASLFGARRLQEVDVALNGVRVGVVHLTPWDNGPDTFHHVALRPPARLRSENLLTLRPSDIRTAKELGLNDDEHALGVHLRALALDLDLPRLRRGERVTFAIGGTGAALVRSGWSWPEDHGRWSVGPASEIVFAVAPDEAVTRLHLQLRAALGGQRDAQDVEVSLNGIILGTVRLAVSDGPERARSLPLSSGADLLPRNVLTFRPMDVRPPSEVGVDGDERPLGIQLEALWLE